MSISARFDTPSFLINTRNRELGTTTNFSYKIPIKQNNNYNLVALTSLTISKTWTTINSFNNVFELTEGTTTIEITVPTGNYDVCNFPTVLSKLLTDASPNNYTYKVFYDFSNNKYTFKAFTDVLGLISFRFYNDGIHEIMGFEDNTTYLFSGDSLTSNNTINMQLTRYLTLKSNIANNFGNSDSDSSILARIPVEDVEDFGVVHYTVNQIQDQAKAITNNRSNIYTFSLYDDHDRIINNNGVEWMSQLFMWEHNTASQITIDRITSQVFEEEEIKRIQFEKELEKNRKKKEKEKSLATSREITEEKEKKIIDDEATKIADAK